MPDNKKSLEIQDNKVSQKIEQVEQQVPSYLEKKKLEQQAQNELEQKNNQQQIETWLHADTFDAEVDALMEKVQRENLSDEEKKRLYDEIVKKHDKSIIDTTKTIAENVADGMGMIDKVENKRNIKNTLLWAGWAAAVGWIASKWKSWFGKKENTETTNTTETKDSKGNTVINVDATPKKNWFQRNWGWLVWGAWVVGAWVYFKDKLHKIPVIGTWLDKLFNAPEVSFEDSFTNFKSDIKSGEVEKHLAVNPGISYEKVDEKTMKLKSYNKEILIDIEKRTVQGMEDVVFPNFKELLHAANLINFSWAAFQWICANTVPFKLTSLGWDIEVKLLDSWDKELVSGAGIPIGKIAWWIVGVLTTILWAVYGWWVPWGAAWAGIWIAAVWWWHLMDQSDALSQYCPTLNNDANKEKFRARLNKIPNLTQWNQEKKPDNTSPLHPALNKVIDEITATATDSDFENQGNARQLDAVQDSKDKNKYRIVSWSQETCITLKNNQVVIDWLDVLLPINEWIRIANLTNKIKRENARQWSSKQPFHRRWTLESAWFPWLYMSTNEFNDNWTKWRRIIKKETIEKKYPTLYDNKDKYIDYLHTLKDENNNPLWIV